MKKNRRFGAHWLAFLGGLSSGQGQQLEDAARIAAEEGCTLFELACNPINQMGAEETAKSLLAGGISEASYCRFYPDDSFGDPLGEGAAIEKAAETFFHDILFIQELRKHGLSVHFITGPSCFVLGKKYAFEDAERHRRLVRFASKQAELVRDAELTVCLEYLRPGEDNGAIGGVKNMVRLIDAVDSRSIRFHADTFHMIKCNEDPWKVVRYAGDRIAYLHAHGTDRVAPGAYCLDGVKEATDLVNWHLVASTLIGTTFEGPVVPEPFGATIREQVPALGEGLPPAIDPRRYYHLAHEHLTHMGIL